MKTDCVSSDFARLLTPNNFDSRLGGPPCKVCVCLSSVRLLLLLLLLPSFVPVGAGESCITVVFLCNPPYVVHETTKSCLLTVSTVQSASNQDFFVLLLLLLLLLFLVVVSDHRASFALPVIPFFLAFDLFLFSPVVVPVDVAS